MSAKLRVTLSIGTILVALSFALTCIPLEVINASPQLSRTSLKHKAVTQKMFDTPEQAVDALIQAAERADQNALLEIFGADGFDIISSGDAVEDKNARTRFLELAREKKSVSVDAFDPFRANLTIGNQDWPFPVPIIQRNGKWYFDTREGRIEVLARRIGDNELVALDVCQGYVEAEIEYASEDRNGNGQLEYAQRIISTPGKRDGLAWRNADGSWAGPVGPAVAKALADGYQKKTEPFHGYHFRVLMAQGRSAPLGALNYVVKGSMIGGFALIAWPDRYLVSGVQTFIVSNDGVVYEKDLGPQSARIASRIQTFDPGPGWRPVEYVK